MSKQEPDILQIKKYLNGELDAKAMHLLERRAQDDPFLMDALEGYEGTAGENQEAQLADLAARLQQRIQKKGARVIPLQWMAAAASVLIAFAAGGIWYFNKTAPATFTAAIGTPKLTQAPPVIDTASIPEKENEIAVVKQGVVKSDKHSIKKTPHIKNAVAEPIFTPQIANAIVKTADTGANETPLDEMIVMDLAGKKRKTNTPPANNSVITLLQGKAAGVAISKNSIKGIVISRDNGLPVAGALVKFSNSPVETFTDPGGHFVLPADSGKAKISVSYFGYNTREVTVRKKDSVKIALQPDANMLGEVALTGYTTQRKKDIAGSVAVINSDKFSPQSLIKGKVIGKDDGLPIPGASVKLKGTATATQTDANGRFTLKADSANAKLIVTSIGYSTIETPVKKRDSLQILAMVPAQSSLNEVVVTGYSAQKQHDEVIIVDAHPDNGWGSFRKYLHNSAKAADGVTGTVKVSFTILPNGEVTGIKVIKSLSPAADKKAMALIIKGPKWAGSTSGKSEVVTVRIKFIK